ncbi:transposase [Thorsellia kenyensis]|uniref:Transposase n=1 Tax=Thorsellia kenyensis TaxID=1549888 RepID=A0ABV6CAH8_9GAMM
MQKILSLYGLRWQIELFFKELKSFFSLKKVSTGNTHIIKMLI